MIEYANELIKEIQSQKPTDATVITVNGAIIDSVRYTGVGLEISCGNKYVPKDEYDELMVDWQYLDDELGQKEGYIDRLKDCLKDIKRIVNDCKEHSGQDFEDDLDEIYDRIEEILK